MSHCEFASLFNCHGRILDNYDLTHRTQTTSFRNALGGPMPINQQATYLQGQDITIDVTLTAHHKGHFEFAACAISVGERPTKGKYIIVQNQVIL